MDESFEPIIPYGFFSEGFLDLNDSSLVIQYDSRVIIERPDAGNDSFQSLVGQAPPVPPRVKRVFRPLEYIRVCECKKIFLHC